MTMINSLIDLSKAHAFYAVASGGCLVDFGDGEAPAMYRTKREAQKRCWLGGDHVVKVYLIVEEEDLREEKDDTES